LYLDYLNFWIDAHRDNPLTMWFSHSKRVDLPLRQKITLTLALSVLYYVGGKIGLSYAAHGIGSPLWPPSGIGMASAILFGFRQTFPGILIGSILFNFHDDKSLVVVSSYFASRLVECGLGSFILEKNYPFGFKFKNSKDVLIFLLVAVILSPLAATLVGSIGPIIEGRMPSDIINYIFIGVFTGNAMGILVFTPFLLSLFEKRSNYNFSVRKCLEAVSLLVFLFLLTFVAIRTQRNFLIMPFIIWAALRFGHIGVTCSSFIVTTICIWYSHHGNAVFSADSYAQDVLWIQAFAGVCTMCGFLIAGNKDNEKENAINFEHKKIAEEALALVVKNHMRLDFAQKASGMGIFEWTKDSNKIFFTPELEHMYGYHIGEFDGTVKTWAKHIHPKDYFRVKREVVKIHQGQDDISIEFRIIKKNGSTSWIVCRGGCLRNDKGEVTGFTGVNFDLTEQKVIEERLRLAETGFLESLASRDEFMAIASHELKTPLTSLKLQVQLYQRGLNTGNLRLLELYKVSDLLFKNASQIDRLTRLVDDMLDVSRIRTGKLTLKKETCDLSKIVKDILDRSREQFESSGSGVPRLDINDDAIGVWDSMRIEQVISNLISNSIRYGRGKPISIHVKNLGSRVRLSVKDQGPGVSVEDRQRIFQRFERGENGRDVSGLGLGLFISEQIVVAHGGQIWVDSEVGKGATFHLELPNE